MSKVIQDAELGNLTVYPEFFQDGNSEKAIQDAEGSAIFFARQLEHIKAKNADVKYPELMARQVFPVSNEAGEGADTITVKTYDQVGMAEFIGAYDKGLPSVDISGKETTIKVRETGLNVRYTLSELRKAVRAGLPIDAMKMRAAIRGHEQRINKVAFDGDAARGLIGLFSHPNIPNAVAPNGAAVSPLWSTKTADEILADLVDCVDSIWLDTKQVHRANTLLMTPALFSLIKNKRIGAANDVSVLTYFLANNQFITNVNQIMTCNELVGAGTGGTNCIVAMEKSVDNFTLEIPMEPKFHPEQRLGLEIVIPTECSLGGLLVNYPLAINITYGV